MDYEAEYDGYGGVSSVKNFYISHRFQVVRSRNQAIQTLTDERNVGMRKTANQVAPSCQKNHSMRTINPHPVLWLRGF